ncbi:hypothetical protein M885DRAFT_577718 [Pelagophyceae sp. CCMP2097]|nr:hypothetical protein M885DRAFT_577718 [Pelagophyceae sp. CCMP2097]
MQRLNPLVPMPPDGVEADPALGLDVQHLGPHGYCTPALATRDGNQHTRCDTRTCKDYEDDECD